MMRTWSVASAAIGAAASVLGFGYYWLLHRPLAQTQGMLRLQGLEHQVEIVRDRWGVPHIYAQNGHDLMFAQGFVHAQDRLWQMDFQRRLVSGRLSEVMGDVTVPVDRWIRTIGMRRVAEQEEGLINQRIKADLQAYAAGVNARIAQGRLPIEFTLLRYKPEPWKVADTLSWIKMMSWSLSVNWEAEILRAQLIDRLGAQRAAELEPVHLEQWPYIVVPPGANCSTIGGESLERAQEARQFTGPPAYAGLGSNSWVLSGSRTESGAPLLANDMHLSMNLPCIWYENHLISDDFNVIGITFPGIPGAVSGHNGYVAWGFTNGFADVQDLYMEHLRHTDDGGVQYEYQGEWLDAQIVREKILVKGGKSVIEEVIITRHGPIINGLSPDFVGEQPLALRWISLEPDTMIEGLHAMNSARSCMEFREALRHWTAPVQNTVYADTEGNIGYSYTGKIPIRARGRGEVPVPGWTGEYEWIGYLPFDELPHLHNPPTGYIATANNRVIGEDYPYYIGSDYCPGDRAQRIVELIEARDRIDMAYVKQMQFDQVSPTARVIAQYMGELSTDDPELAPIITMMRRWDGRLSVDSPAAAVHQVFVRRLIRLLLSARLGDLVDRYVGKGPTPALAESSLFGEKAWTWLQKVLAEPTSHWFELDRGKTREGCMYLALRETLDFLRAKLGPETAAWSWGKLHTLTYAHVLSTVKPLDKLFNRGPYPLGGDGSTLWATGASLHNLSNENVIGPPFRFVADLGDLGNSLGLLSPGQSGQLGSKHYDDQIRAWFDGEYHPLLYDRQDVEKGAAARLKLLPRLPEPRASS